MMVTVEQPKRKRVIRAAAGEVWEDNTLADWPDGMFFLNIFVSCVVC